MNREVFQTQIGRLRERSPQSSHHVIDAFERWVSTSDPLERIRIDAYAVAAVAETSLEAVVPVMLGGVDSGLFNLHWDVHCPHCSMVTDSYAGLFELTGGSACSMCEQTFDVDFLLRVEVAFSLSDDIEVIDIAPICEPPPFVNVNFDMMIHRDETVTLVELMETAGHYHYLCPITMSRGDLILEGELWDEADGPQRLNITQHERSRFEPPRLTARPGSIEVSVTNVGYEVSGLMILEAVLPPIPESELPPFLSGLHIIHYPAYRALFGDHALSTRERIKLTSVTTMFTDIKDSTALYERVGDAAAYQMVRDHFDVLFGAIEDHGGMVVKTIGDAVMASFVNNESAARCAVTIHRALASADKADAVVVKIGIHRGPAFLVNLNGRVDYFGSTVNRGARIQGCARGGEVTFSDEVYQDATVRRVLDAEGVTNATAHEVNLKGIGGQQTIRRVAVTPSR